MNFKDKTSKTIEIDDMNIKPHLNASLDLRGISVSEDLIHRTLEAIQKQAAQQIDRREVGDDQSPKERVMPWNRYVRAFAGVAAAAMIIVTGYGLISGAGYKKDAADTQDQVKNSIYSTTADNSAQEASPEYAAADSAADKSLGSGAMAGIASADTGTADTAADDNTLPKDDIQQFTITADTDMSDSRKETNGSAGTASINEDSLGDQPIQNNESAPLVTFRDIFLPDPAQAQSLTITDGNHASVTLTKQDEIVDFYSIMDKYQFSYSTNADTEKSYTVTISAPLKNEANYVMTIGKDIIVDFSDDETASHSTYSVTDSASLLEDLQKFVQKYQK